MPFYPDWVVALDDVAKGKPGAELTARNAQDVIQELTVLKAQVKAFTTPEADRTTAEKLSVSTAHLVRAARGR